MTSQPNLPQSKQSWVKFKVSNAYLEIVLHSGFPCINFVFEIMIPKKGSKPKNLIKQTIYRWFQVPAPNLSYFGPFLTFSLIFLNFSFMIS